LKAHVGNQYFALAKAVSFALKVKVEQGVTKLTVYHACMS